MRLILITLLVSLCYSTSWLGTWKVLYSKQGSFCCAPPIGTTAQITYSGGTVNINDGNCTYNNNWNPNSSYNSDCEHGDITICTNGTLNSVGNITYANITSGSSFGGSNFCLINMVLTGTEEEEYDFSGFLE
jgi:hypothetical protein